MAAPSVTYTFTNGSTADASQVNQNFTDLINAMTDASKSFSIDALTVAGAATFNGNVTIGNASGDAISVTGTTTFNTTPLVDTINEKTSTNGVQIKGRTNTTAISAGYIGEKITWTTPPSSQDCGTSEGDWTNAAISLTAGRWLIIANLQMSAILAAGAAAGAYAAAYALITLSNNTVVDNMYKQIEIDSPVAVTSAASMFGIMTMSLVVSIDTTTTYKIRVNSGRTGGGNAGRIWNQNGAYSEFFGIRIA